MLIEPLHPGIDVDASGSHWQVGNDPARLESVAVLG